MNSLALLLILVAAVVHATWNYLAKHSGGSIACIWLFGAISTVIYFPVVVIAIGLYRPHLGGIEILFLIVSSLLHTGYFLLLTRGYRSGDLSIVYPLSRCSAPMITILLAISILHERPSAMALCGAISIVCGMFYLIGNLQFVLKSGSGRSVGYAFMTGLTIAVYSMVDKYTVSNLFIPPILLCYIAIFGRVLLLTPYAVTNWKDVQLEWVKHRYDVIGIALLDPLSFILVLSALVFTPVSYVAPAREISILIGTFMGARLLGEGNMKRRTIGSAIMVIGMIVLALG
ncbi:MAG: EamA family transporter [Nitrospinales bacterium]